MENEKSKILSTARVGGVSNLLGYCYLEVNVVVVIISIVYYHST